MYKYVAWFGICSIFAPSKYIFIYAIEIVQNTGDSGSARIHVRAGISPWQRIRSLHADSQIYGGRRCGEAFSLVLRQP